MKILLARTSFECRTRARTGSVALMLALILTLLVGTFAASVTRRASNEPRNELHHRSIAVLESAIDAVAESDLKIATNVRLPLDDASKRWVTINSVVTPDADTQYEATLYHHDRPGLSIRRIARSDQ